MTDSTTPQPDDATTLPEAPTPEPTSWLHPDPVEPVGLETPPAEDEAPSLAGNADYEVPTNDGSGFASVHTYEFADRGVDIAFDLTTVDPDNRRLVSERLSGLGVRHHFSDSTTLTAGSEDATAVQGVIDEIAAAGHPVDLVDVPESDDVEEVISEADEEDDEIVFDLSTLSVEERRHLSMRLTGAGISHIWEVGSDLVVSVEDAPAIERYVEEVRNPEGFGDDELASFDEASDVDDEEVYSAMSNLYVAADKLMQKPADEATAGEFYVAVDDVDGLPAPFGFDPRVWAQVQELANKIADTLDAEGDPDTVGDDARTLRHILANYV
ncbi:MAG TPA: hypothetical protein VHC63_14685 [Acidimicrobiales bacterium]|nr:hypothetical protein [Acidimicrobiales bacterium]